MTTNDDPNVRAAKKFATVVVFITIYLVAYVCIRVVTG